MPYPDDQPLISIVINNYNYAQFLGRAIESALGQRYARVEVIVVDDGSTDESVEVIARYRDHCIAIMQPQRGQGAAYNSGFQASHGDVVVFLDSDDLLYPDAASEIARAWQPDVAKVQFPLDAIDAVERPLGHRVPNIPFAADALALVLSYGYYPSPPGSGNAYSRAALQQMLPADETIWRVGSDGLVIGLAPLYGRVVSLRRALGAYRYHDRNHSEASGTNLVKIRRDLANELSREAAIRQHAAAQGRRIGPALSLRIPGHCKGRLLSLRLDRPGHPYADDTALGLARAGVAACWRFPHHRLGKRLAASFAFALLPFVSVRWLTHNLEAVIVARRRRNWLRRLLPSAEGAIRPPLVPPQPVGLPRPPASIMSRENS